MKLKIIIATALISTVLLGCQQEETGSTNPEKEVGDETPAVNEGEKNMEEKTEQDKEPEESEESEEVNTTPAQGTGSENGQTTEEEKMDENSTETAPKDEGEESGQSENSNGMVTVENATSLKVLVNKSRKLPDGYRPPDLVTPNVPFSFEGNLEKRYMRKEAAAALEDLFKAAEQANLDLVAASGYRSYERQKEIYQNFVKQRGQEEADKFSARPGTSEHQTGLAMDVTSAEMAFALKQTFKQTNEGTWLAENAHHYGFIIRYPEGKSDITGYSYEPWHIRYVGREVAKEIHEKDITLEEYME